MAERNAEFCLEVSEAKGDFFLSKFWDTLISACECQVRNLALKQYTVKGYTHSHTHIYKHTKFMIVIGSGGSGTRDGV